MQIFEQYKDNTTILLLKEKIVKKTKNTNYETLLHTVDKTYKSSCIKCHIPQCSFIKESSITIDELEDFSFDKDVYNCPVDAITINKGYPTIDNEKCILCGLCIANCPAGAMYYDKKNQRIKINRDITDLIYLVKDSNKNIVTQQQQIEQLVDLKDNIRFENISTELLENIQKKLQSVESKYHNKIVRNILIGLGCKAIYPRIGDVGNRMDGIFKSEDGYIGVLEVEFGTDSLSTARCLLDDIVMLKYKYKLDNIKPLAVLVTMPNNRQDYWNVIYDIKNVTGITIHTMTICSLLILLWNKSSIDLTNNSYYADVKKPSIREALEKNINTKIDIPVGYLGILEPEK